MSTSVDLGTQGISLGTANGLTFVNGVLGLGTANGSNAGALSAADWTSFNGKAPNILPSSNQAVFVNYLAGSDSTGNGSFGLPFQTVAHAMTTITDASQNKPYAIILLGARQIETGDLFIKPYTFIVGQMQRASYLRVNGGSIKPDPSHATGTSWVGFSNVYIGGATALNWDLHSVGGSNCTMVISNCTLSGNFTYNGRNAGGGDFLEMYVGIVIGTTTLDSVYTQIQSFETGGLLSCTNSQAVSGLSGTINNCVLDSGIAINAVATLFLNNVCYGAGVGITTTGTVGLTSFRGLPATSLRTLSGGTTTTNIDNASVVPYTPADASKWASTPPATVQQAIDRIAAVVGNSVPIP